MKRTLMVRCACQACRCDKRVSARNPDKTCAYCLADTHRVAKAT